MGNTSTTGENTSAMPGGEFDTGAPSPEARAGGATAVVVLGTGGTIAGTSAQRGDNVGYTAGQTPVLALLEALGQRAPVPPGLRIESEQVAQIDSKDMTHALWRRLTERIAAHLARPEVAAVLVTHGTDTLEETAYLVQRVLAPEKPVVFTAAMRPADALQADGPQNLLDALTVAAHPCGLQGVMLVLAGKVWAGSEARKVHPYRLDAFDAGDAGALAVVEEGRLRCFRAAVDAPPALGLQVLARDIWPEVQIVTSHGGAEGRIVELLLESGVQGLVVACTGNGTVHQDLLAVLLRAQHQGVAVLRALRGGGGSIVAGGAEVLPSAGGLTAAQARVELLLRLLARGA